MIALIEYVYTLSIEYKALGNVGCFPLYHFYIFHCFDKFLYSVTSNKGNQRNNESISNMFTRYRLNTKHMEMQTASFCITLSLYFCLCFDKLPSSITLRSLIRPILKEIIEYSYETNYMLSIDHRTL